MPRNYDKRMYERLDLPERPKLERPKLERPEFERLKHRKPKNQHSLREMMKTHL